MAVPDSSAARLATPVLVAGIAAALALLAWNALAAETAERAAVVPLLIGMFLLGMPHGALDHLVPARMGAAWGRRPASLTLFLGGYVGLAAVLLRGALPVTIPVLGQPDVVEGLLTAAVSAIGTTVAGGLGSGAPAVRWGLGASVLALAGAYFLAWHSLRHLARLLLQRDSLGSVGWNLWRCLVGVLHAT